MSAKILSFPQRSERVRGCDADGESDLVRLINETRVLCEPTGSAAAGAPASYPFAPNPLRSSAGSLPTIPRSSSSAPCGLT